MGYLEQYDLAQDADFRKRVEVAVAQITLDVLSEAPNTPNHAARANLVRSIMANRATEIPQVALAVAANASISGASTDAEIKAAMVDVFSRYAG